MDGKLKVTMFMTFMVIIFLFLSSYKTDIEDYVADSKVKECKKEIIRYTESKYGQEISIPSKLYDDEEIDSTGSDLALLADAVTSAGDHFTISYYEKFSISYAILHFRNEVTIQDDYAKLLYDPEIRERTEEIMDQFLEKDEYTYDISYAMTDKK